VTRREFVRRMALGATAIGAACAAPRAPGAATSAQPSGEAAGPSRQALRVLVLGGTRFVGAEIVRAALARAHRVTIFHRGRTNPGLFGADVETLLGDRDGALDALRGRDFEAVVDTSGYVPRVVRQSADLLAAHAERYLFVSTIAAYAKPVPPGADESAPLARLASPASEDVARDYGPLKAACEGVVHAAFRERALLVRPGLVAGPGDPTDRFTYWPARFARGGEVLAPGDGADPVQLVDVRDLAAFAVALLEERASGAFHVVGPAHRLPMRELLARCEAAAGASARTTWVDAAFLARQRVQPWTDLPLWVPSAASALAQLDASKAISRGLSFRPLADTARDTLEWWRRQPEKRRARPQAGLDPAREAAVLAAWHRARGR
jgi:2'-hydroxyisoflavone reductase